MEPTDLLLEVAGVCDVMRLPYFVTGSMASTYYGEYRTTHDVDIVVELPSWKAKEFCGHFPEPAYYVDPDAALRAVQEGGMFNIIHVPSSLKVDVITFGAKAGNEGCLVRARKVEVRPGRVAMFIAPEDSILSKLEFYKMGGSDKHLRDIASILRISGEILDRSYLDHWAMRLGVSTEWKVILDRVAEVERAEREGGGPPVAGH